MMIWTIFAAMTGGAIFALLWPLSHGGKLAFADKTDAASLYRSQIEEIDKDVSRALIGPSEAEAARAEAARRLLRATAAQAAPAGETEPSLRRRRASSALMLSVVPLLALLVYGLYGSPAAPDQPLAARVAQAGPQQDFAVVFARMEAHLAANPNDTRGWSLIAPIYLRQGRYDDAERAYAAAMRSGQPDAEIWAGLGEARTLAASGVVTASAREAFAESLKQDPQNARSAFYLAVAKEQDGDRQGAVAALRALVSTAPPDADWAGMVQAKIDSLQSVSAPDAIASLPAEQRDAAIRGMVDGLAGRLDAGGGTLEEWTRLIRARAVLGQKDEARAAILKARERLAQDAAALAAIDGLSDELALKEASP
jgi:cytochrome c-type biogenesis protein CcmH